MKVYIDPVFTRVDKGDGGIRRVVEAQRKYLPEFGIEVTDNIEEADLINNHGAAHSWRKGVPVVSSCHGLYWSRYGWSVGYQEVNKAVIHSLRIADAHTATSDWVSTAMRRGMLIYPEVVYHGVDIEDWDISDDPMDYILWNKARHDAVSDKGDLFQLASIMPNRRFVSTVGNATANVKIVGKVPYEEMKGIVKQAGVYLATARETFGIGTLEAMASGVPVVGWDWGGQSEIVINGQTGYLAPPGDYEALAECVELAFEHRKVLAENARHDVEKRWGWKRRIYQYADLFKRTKENYEAPATKVSVILTAHNLGKYLGDALNSVSNQTLQDWECIIVDDVSEDGTPEISKGFVERDNRFKYFRPDANLGLSLARNYGIEKASGRYIIPFDADDMLDPQALRIMSDALDNDPATHIVYGNLDTVSDDGSNRKKNDWPPRDKDYSWRQQMAHLNQLPYCAMMRRSVFDRGGGYRKRHWRAEDAAMWCRLTSLGFQAKKVTERALLIYRWTENSKSRQEVSEATEKKERYADGDWTAWYPWRIASSPRSTDMRVEAKKHWNRIIDRKVPDPVLVPFGAQGVPPKDRQSWYVHDYAYPKVSVIIPCGKGHEEFLVDAIESVLAQTYPDWEIIVVNDTGKGWKAGFGSPIAGCPYIRVIETPGEKGPAYARNRGAEVARGEAILPLDADDYLMPNALERMAAYLEEFNGIVYSGWLRNQMDGTQLEYYEPKEFKCGDVLTKMHHSGSSILIPMWLHKKIGGWDEECPGWEDWEYLISAQVNGACSYLVPEPLFVYRFYSGTQRETSYGNASEIVEYINEKWYDYRTGDKKLMCGCNKKKAVASSPVSALSSSGNFEPESNPMAQQEVVLLEYNGPAEAPITMRGKVTGRRYRFGKQGSHRRKYVKTEDAEQFLEINYKMKPLFRLVQSANEAVVQQAGTEQFVDLPVGNRPTQPDYPVLA